MGRLGMRRRTTMNESRHRWDRDRGWSPPETDLEVLLASIKEHCLRNGRNGVLTLPVRYHSYEKTPKD
ncbi:hypothetical protein M8818_001166 [Zalaria obscura]|uniref:Uncharacterized protein n=1 Tax=Zalaria obscura TaxID=2024903 RepID=A0ACC3SME4_9PEZI